MEYVLQTFNLSKKYGSQMAVDQVNINIRKGDIYGFVGANGSGKTTIIRMITGLVAPHNGRIQLFGVDSTSPRIHQVRRQMGAVVESPAIYLNMTAADNLRMQAKLLGMEDEQKVRQTLNTVGLAQLYGSKKCAANFSLGMRQRLGIAMALMGDPQFLILDEPMNGLDPTGIVELRELILELNRQGITFLISSHILSELSLIATKYGIISQGKLLQEITAQQLHARCGKHLLLRSADPQALLVFAQHLLPEHPIALQGDAVKISGDLDVNAFIKTVIENGHTIQSVNCTQTGFEEYYLSVLGGNNHG